MSNFSKGDIVIIVENRYSITKPGTIGVIKSFRPYESEVKFISPINSTFPIDNKHMMKLDDMSNCLISKYKTIAGLSESILSCVKDYTLGEEHIIDVSVDKDKVISMNVDSDIFKENYIYVSEEFISQIKEKVGI